MPGHEEQTMREENAPRASTLPSSRGEVDFVSLFLAHQRSVYRYILSLLPSAQDADDLLQETAGVLWSRFGEFQPGSSFLAWACQVAYYKVLEHRRRAGRAAILLDEDVLEELASLPLARDSHFDVERTALAQCLERLVPKDRLLLERRYSPAMTGKVLAAKLGRPANSVYKSLGRIRRTLLLCIRRTLAAGERERAGL